jgi:L-rhamnonate dehydratase
MKITRVSATPLNLPVSVAVAGGTRSTSLSVCLVEIETDTGLSGTGMTAITEEEVIASIVNDIAAHHLVGLDPMRHEQIWERLYWLLTPRGQSGYASHAIAALDLALWDIKGQALGEPCWRLLGGARAEVPVYATFGFAFFDRDELAQAARDWVARGFTRLKMTVGHHGLQRRDEPRALDGVIAEDVQRIRAVREAVGPDVQIYIDANCSLDYFHALSLAQRIEPYSISFFEEPVSHNDIPNLVKLRAKTSIPWRRARTKAWLRAFATCWWRRPWTWCSPTPASAAGLPNVDASPAWRLHSTRTLPMAAPGRTTTCTCMQGWPMAHWSNTTRSRCNVASWCLTTCPSPPTAY